MQGNTSTTDSLCNEKLCIYFKWTSRLSVHRRKTWM